MASIPQKILHIFDKIRNGNQVSAQETMEVVGLVGKHMDFLDLLPLTLQLNGKPMDVANRRPMFAPLFRKKRMSKREIYLCSRQVSKTTSAAGSMLMNLIWRSYFNVIYVAPLAIYANRLHHVHFSPMINSCGLPVALQDKSCVNNVNEKSFLNGSHFHGASCWNSPGQVLGIKGDSLIFDETQDLNIDHVPMCRETLRTSDYRWETYLGTARGMENTIQILFDESSAAEFHLRCGCKSFGRYIIPDKTHDAISMIQPHGIACPDCSRLLNVEAGEWVHRHPDRAQDQREDGIVVKSGFAGYHVPCTIVRDLITPYDRYLETIYDKLHGVSRYSESKFFQEVLGISSEQGGRPITPEEIERASTLDIRDNGVGYDIDHYANVAGGQDWGGAEVTSFTIGTVVGWHPEGKFHCLGASRPTGIPDNERHIPMAAFFQKVGQGRMIGIGADAGFVGSVQNRNLGRISGIKTANIAYGTQKLFFAALPMNNFVVDRTTLIYITYTLIREGYLLFPKGQWFQSYTKDLTATFIEDVEAPNGMTIRRYCRYKQRADDFLHALGYAVFICALTHNIDLPSMLGLGYRGSLSAPVIDIIGEEGASTFNAFALGQ